MSDSKTSRSGGVGKTQTRNLPSWMSSRENESKSNKSNDGNGHGEGSNNTNFSKLMEGVVFVLSGFVNPERSTLRSQALAMGAEYQPDWNSNCTLLVCAFQNTPKFRQVEADCGTIVSKEWILECYAQKKLVDIDPYLMHAGKPWRRSNISHETSEGDLLCFNVTWFILELTELSNRTTELLAPPLSDLQSGAMLQHLSKKSMFLIQRVLAEQEGSSSTKSYKQVEKSQSKRTSSPYKPEPHEIKQIAGAGILTCLQDAIDCLEQKQDVRQITEQWSFVPRVVKELAMFEGSEHGSLTKEDLLRKAKVCQQIYEDELTGLDGDSSSKNKKPKTDGGEEGKKGGTKASSRDATGYDSDETIEMTEEEIDLAYKNFASETL
ncbi:hypothetical protein POUND7_003541 [Theobroma cacao]